MKKRNEMLAGLALEMGLDVRGGGLFEQSCLEGNYRGRDIKFYMIVRGSGKHRKKYTIFEVGHSIGLTSDIHLSREGLFTKIAKTVGFKEITVGNPDFDEKFYIRTKDPAAIHILDIEVQQQLMRMKNIPEIRPDKLYIESVGNYSSKEQIREAFDELIALSDCLEHKKDGIF